MTACRIGVISNANSRANRLGSGDRERLREALGRRGEVAATTTMAELDRALERFRAEEIEVLGIHGGDGTIHHTLTAAVRIFGTQLPRLAILPGGTMNTLARGLTIRGPRDVGAQLLDYLATCLETGRAPRLTRRRLVKVGERYGLIFGNGVMYHFAKEYYAQGKPHPWSGAQLLSRVVTSALIGGPLAKLLLLPFRAQVAEDERVWGHDRFLTIAAASVPEAGYGFAMLPHARDRLDGLAVTGIHTSPRGLVAELPKMYFSAPFDPRRCTTTTTRRLTITSDQPMGYTLDGDLYLAGSHLEIEAGPQVEIALPPRSPSAAPPPRRAAHHVQ
jgi:diacylglycerol kinase family enzyme